MILYCSSSAKVQDQKGGGVSQGLKFTRYQRDTKFNCTGEDRLDPRDQSVIKIDHVGVFHTDLKPVGGGRQVRNAVWYKTLQP